MNPFKKFAENYDPTEHLQQQAEDFWLAVLVLSPLILYWTWKSFNEWRNYK